MLKEFIDAISDLAVKSAGPQIAKHNPYEPSAVKNAVGDVVIDNGIPKPRNHVAYDLEAIVEFSKKSSSAAIWYSRKKIVTAIDDNDRKDIVTLAMSASDELVKLQELQKSKPWFDQRAFLTLLRTVFTSDAMPMNTTLINDIRVVKFEAAQSGSSEIGRGKSSVGKSAMASVEGWDKLPEVVVLDVPVFANRFASQRTSVKCALEINEQEQRFQLFPLPGSVEDAITNIEGDIGATIREMIGDTVPVYYGEM